MDLQNKKLRLLTEKRQDFMDEQMVSLAAASVVRLCFDRLRERDWEGRIYTRCSLEPEEFHGMSGLLMKLEEFYDWLDYPQVSTVNRYFQEGGQEKELARRAERRKNRKGVQAVVMSAEDMEKKHGGQATFVVRIQYRQNATWQGQVTWAEKKKTLPFRSALELLKLIDSTDPGHSGNWEE